MRIWGPHKRIPESGFKNPDPEAFALSFGRIRGSGLSPDPESFCVLCFNVHLMDPDSRIRIRIRVTHTSFRKILNMNFRRKNADPRLPLSGSAYILCLVFTKMVVPV